MKKRAISLILALALVFSLIPTAFAADDGVLATPTTATVLVNGTQVAFDAYNINGANFFKLRDLAYVLSGTEKQFEVSYDTATKNIALTSGRPYTTVGGELASSGGTAQNAAPTPSTVLLDGQEVSLTAYNIGGANYFMLRDIGQLFDFGVGWDGETKTITIDTSMGYTNDNGQTVDDVATDALKSLEVQGDIILAANNSLSAYAKAVSAASTGAKMSSSRNKVSYAIEAQKYCSEAKSYMQTAIELCGDYDDMLELKTIFSNWLSTLEKVDTSASLSNYGAGYNSTLNVIINCVEIFNDIDSYSQQALVIFKSW